MTLQGDIICDNCNKVGKVEWVENTPNYWCPKCKSTWATNRLLPHSVFQNKGHHHFMDVVQAHGLDGERLLIQMALAATEAGATVVHKHCAQLPLIGGTSPPGFAAVCLLDESHVSAHYYADEGLLAVDAFTCGSNDKAAYIIAHLSAYISHICKDAFTTLEHHTRRFLHADTNE